MRSFECRLSPLVPANPSEINLKEAAITQPDTVHFFESRSDLDSHTSSDSLVSSASASGSRALRIALLGYRSDPYSGGQGVYIHYLSKALTDAGHRVDVISGPPYPRLDPRIKLIKLPSLDLFQNGLGSIRPRNLLSITDLVEWISKLTGGFAEPYSFGRRALKYLLKHRDEYDLIHDNQSLSFGMLKIQSLGFPLVTTIHHPITNDLRIALSDAPTWQARLLILRWHSFLKMQVRVARRLRHVVTVSQCSQKDIASDFALSLDRIRVIYNGIDTNVFKPIPEIKRHSNLVMATASADAPLKGVRYLLEAFAILLQKYPNLELVLVGKLHQGGNTEQLIKDLNLISNISFVSGISTTALVKMYAQATLVIVPSVYEGFGFPAAEAMSCGVAVVSTNGGALPEIVGDSAMVVPTRDSKALADAASKLLEEPSLREVMEKEAREHIKQRFSWEACAKNMTKYYESIVANADD